MTDTDRVSTDDVPDSAPIELRDADIAWQELEGEIVVLDTARGAYLLLNASAAVLWAAVAAGTTRSDLVQILVARYGLTDDLARQDVDAFLGTLAERELVKA